MDTYAAQSVSMRIDGANPFGMPDVLAVTERTMLSMVIQVCYKVCTTVSLLKQHPSVNKSRGRPVLERELTLSPDMHALGILGNKLGARNIREQ
jgi:hypothetical protein